MRGISISAEPVTRSLLLAGCEKLDIAAALEELEITNKIKLVGTQLEAGETDDIGEVSVAVTPVERGDHSSVPCAGRKTFAIVRVNFVQRDGAEPFALDDNVRRIGHLRIRLYPWLDRLAQPDLRSPAV